MMLSPADRLSSWEGAWPSYEMLLALPRGHAWLTLLEAPTSHLWLVSKDDGNSLPAIVGCPLPLDPRKEYGLRAAAHPEEALAYPAGVTAFAWRARTIRVLLSAAPASVGAMRGAFRVTGNSGNLAGFIVRLATRYLRCVQFWVRSGGDTTTCALYGFDEGYSGLTYASPEHLPGPSASLAANAGVVLVMAEDHTPVIGGAYVNEGPPDHVGLYVSSTRTSGSDLRVSWKGSR